MVDTIAGSSLARETAALTAPSSSILVRQHHHQRKVWRQLRLYVSVRQRGSI